MTATANTAQNTFEILQQCVQYLGVAILPLWGLDKEGNCLCPKGKQCKESRNAGKHPYSKLCPNGVKNATRDLSIIRQWVRQAPNCNWGIRCGEPIPDGGFLGVFDWDPRNGSEASLAEIRSRGDILPETVTQVSGGGGGHRLYRFPKSPASRSIAPGLDFQGAGKYIVISPSKHYTGGVYLWELGQGPGEIKVADAPEWLITGTEEAQARPAGDGGTARETVLGEAFALAGRAGAIMPTGEMFVDCPHSHLHSDSRGRGQDASCVILPPAGGSRFGGFKCQHGHCANLKWQDVINSFTKEIREEAFKKYPRLGAVPPPPEGAPDQPEEELPEDELREIKERLAFKNTTKGSKIIQDIINLVVILKYDPRWKDVLRFDEFSQVLRFTKEPPWHPDDKSKDQTDIWTDADVTRLDLWLRRNWALELPNQKIHECVYIVGRGNSINPLKDYLNGLVWDGQPRIDRWLPTYAGTKDTAYTQSAGRKWLISAVARALDPGCKVDQLIILEGPQGKGKSTLLRTITTGSPTTGDGPHAEWFSDTPIPIGEKDSYVALKGKWIIELPELASLKKADLDRAKAFFSAPVDSYRPPYGRENVSVPRTAVFAGTVNLGEYLNDVTGARRFVPVLCGAIDIETLAADRDQIWAEAVHVYKDWVAQGRKQSRCLWWPSMEEIPMYEEEQLRRQVAGTQHPWTEAIALWLMTEKAQTMLEKNGYLTLREIGMHAINLSDKECDHNTLTGIGGVMSREMKWTKLQVPKGGAKAWGYKPPTAGS